VRLILAVAASIAVHAIVADGRRVRVAVPGLRPLAIASGVGLVGVLVGLPWPSLLAVAVGVVAVPAVVRRTRHSRTARAARDQWPDFLAHVRSRIGSGEPLPDAVRAAARSLGGPFLDLDRAWGGSFLTELDAVRLAWADPVTDRVLMTMKVAAATGGAHVDAVLSALTASLSDEMRIRAAHEAALTQQRLTAGVALVSPWAILALSLATNPQAGSEFATATGRAIVIGGGVATVGGYLLARRAARLSAPPRIFG
jgi:Flp pilus assembly protein TadB